MLTPESLKAIFQGLPNPTFIWQAQKDDFILIDFNQAAVTFSGNDLSQLLGSKANELYKDEPNIRTHFNTCFQSQRNFAIEMNYKTRTSGQLRTVTVNYSYIAPDLVLVQAEEITQRKKNETELTEHNRQLASFIENSPAAIAMLDKELRYIAVSNKWISDYGLQNQELTGRSHYEIFPEIGQDWKDVHQRCLHGAHEKREEDSFTRLDGQTNWMRWEVKPWRDGYGEIGGIIMFTEEITERKKAQEDLKKLNNENEKRVNELKCLYLISEISRKHEYSADSILNFCVESIPNAYQYPEITCARITFKNKTYTSKQFSETSWVQSTPIYLNQSELGKIEVFYAADKPKAFEGPFLREERLLINSIADILGNSTDVRETELNLNASEEKYRYLFNHNPALIIIWDLENLRVCEVNQQVIDTYGYTEDEFKKMSVLDYRPEEDHHKIKMFAEKMLVSEEPMDRNIWTHLKKNGEKMIMEISSHKIDYQNKRAILSLGRDITDRLNAEYELRKSENLFHSLIDQAADAIFMIDENGSVFNVNQAATEILQYSRNELLSKNVNALNLEETQPFVPSLWNKTQATTLLKDERQLVRKDGSLVHVEINRRMLTGGSGAIAIVRDITNRKQAEIELIKEKEKAEENEFRLELAAEAAQLGIWEWNIKQNFFIWDKRMFKEFDLPSRGSSAGFDAWINHIHPYDRENVIEHIKAVLKGKSTFDVTYRIVKTDNSISHIKADGLLLKDENGEPQRMIGVNRDVTEQILASEKLESSRIHLIKILQNSPIASALGNLEFKITFFNYQFTKLFGYTIDDIPHIDEWWLLAYPEESYREKVKNEWFERIRDAEMTHTQFLPMQAKVRCKDGSYRFVEFHYAAMEEEFLVNFNDITARIESEEHLRQSEEKHRALIENISDGIVLLDDAKNFIYQSPSVSRIIGFSLPELKNKTALVYIHPEDQTLFQLQFEQAKNNTGTPTNGQYRTRHKLGHYIWVDITIINLLDLPSVKAYIVIYRDVTERKKFEEQLALSDLIVNSTDDAIISRNTSGLITSWNHGAEKVFGYRANEAIGQPISFLLPSELKDEEKMILKKINTGESIDHYETKRLKKNGNIIDVSLTISPIMSEAGIVMGASKIMRDITSQKQLEIEKVKIMNDLLQRNRDLEQFAYIISHNLRAPVANIMGINALMQSTEFNSDQKAQLNSGLNKSVHALDVIIKDLNHILQTKREINEQKMTVNFSDLVNDIKASISNLIKSEQVTFKIDFSAVNEMLTIKSYLFSIFYNLITNSIKYRKPDVSPIIEIKSIERPNGFEILFIDNGLGINIEKNKEQLFGLYKRFHFHIEGKGMGLYMVKTQVESLGGKISIQSALNNGSEFKIEFFNQ